MKKKGLFSVVQLVGFVLLLALLVSCPGSPDIKDEGGSPPPLITEEDFLNGQWDIYSQKPSGDLELDGRIDIQHTLPGYWIIMGFISPVIGDPIKSDRTETEDGVFVISFYDDKMSYRFVDDERNTMEAECKMGDITMTYILKRIPKGEEIEMHIVSFKLDDSIASDGYTISEELKAIEAGKAFKSYKLPELKNEQLGYTVPAKYTTEDGKDFTNETPVNEDITVIVAPAVGD